VGRVTPELRGVAYLLKGSSLCVRFLYADEPEEWIVEEVSCAETECIADFWPLEVSYVVEHLSVGQPRELQPGERWVYVRYEPPRMMRWWHDDLGGAASFAGEAHVPLRRASRNLSSSRSTSSHSHQTRRCWHASICGGIIACIN
jgi:hypothetical protein